MIHFRLSTVFACDNLYLNTKDKLFFCLTFMKREIGSCCFLTTKILIMLERTRKKKHKENENRRIGFSRKY